MKVLSTFVSILVVTIVLQNSDHLLVSSITPVLISKGKPVSQSSEYTPSPGPASNAVDGNKNQDYNNGKSCTHTNFQINPWWKIDFGSIHDIHRVKIWNRGDCCGERLSSLTIQTSDDDQNFRDVNEMREPATNNGVYLFARQISGRYVRLILSKPEPEALTLCEVEIYGRARQADDLVSKGKQAYQSSEYAPSPGPASFAVDGNKNQVYDSKSCTHTSAETRPWWKVDLGVVHRIYAVKVWNRGDCCGERLTTLKIQGSYDDNLFEDAAELKGNAVNGAVYAFNQTFNGRYVRLTLTKDAPEPLTVCEVEVYGYPD